MNILIAKKALLIISLVITIIVLTIDYIGTIQLCNNHRGDCVNTLHTWTLMFMPFIPILLFSLLTYFLADRIFKIWLAFTAGWIPLTMFLIYITPDHYANFTVNILDKKLVAFLMSGLYFIVSLIIILLTSILIRYQAKKATK